MRSLVLSLLTTLFVGSSVCAVEPLRVALAPVAKDCAKWLAGRKQMDACVGNIIGPQTFPTSASPGLRETLSALLSEQGVVVKNRASIALRVEYRPKDIPDGNNSQRTRFGVSLRVIFVDNREAELADIEWLITHEEAVALILGMTHDRRNRFDAAADKSLALQFFEPKSYFDGSVVLAGDNSPFGMEVRLNGKAITPEDRDGLAYALVPRDQEYTIRLVNRSDREMAVRLTIDGLSVFNFCELRQPEQVGGKPNPLKGQPIYDLILLPAKSEMTVPGWIISPKKSLGFKVTEYPKTAVAQLNRDDLPAGTLTATFSAAWTGDTPPADEPPASRGPGDDGTGFGSPKEIDARPVERKIGAVRASVSIRYTPVK